MQIDPPASSYKALQDPNPAPANSSIPALFSRFASRSDLRPGLAVLLLFGAFLGKMNTMRSRFVPVIVGFMFLTLLQLGYGQSVAPSSAPEAPSNDGKAIDQGIAYILLLVALAITYLLH